jgi:hypothetical protein
MIAESALPANLKDNRESLRDLVAFLLDAGEPRALKAVAAVFESASRGTRCWLAYMIDPFWLRQPSAPKVAANTQDADQAKRILEDAFARDLLQQEPLFHEAFNFGLSRRIDPRPCDIASWILAKLYPGKYRGDWIASALRRDDQCLSNLNIWRQSRGMPPLSTKATMASAARNHRVPPNYVSRVLLRDIPGDGHELAAQLRGLKARVLTSEEIEQIIGTMTSVCEGHNRTGRLYIDRDIDGIRISLDLGVVELDSTGIHGTSATYAWKADVDAVVSGTSSSGDSPITRNVFNEIHRALAAPEEVPFTIDVTIYGKRSPLH